ncbi:hypothetical protein B0H13DRAFT_2357712 [Mycena leptocephala]|nr:hypothetical protein B0H13DRAFT_2357712 [Mycena leptocephala]
MALKAGLKGFCPDLEGPAYSAYNQLHRHIAVSGFQFLSSSYALAALDVNTRISDNTSLMGEMEPKTRVRVDPPLPASEIGVILPPDVPVDFFTPEFYNALTLKERARYMNTGVAFPLEDIAFDEAHGDWKYMGKAEFMAMYGNEFWNEENEREEMEVDEELGE